MTYESSRGRPKRFCSRCGSDTTYIKSAYDGRRSYPLWHFAGRDKCSFLCHNCYCKIVIHPKWREFAQRHKIRFGEKHIYLNFEPRKGVCSECGRSVAKREIAVTNMAAMTARSRIRSMAKTPSNGSRSIRPCCLRISTLSASPIWPGV